MAEELTISTNFLQIGSALIRVSNIADVRPWAEVPLIFKARGAPEGKKSEELTGIRFVGHDLWTPYCVAFERVREALLMIDLRDTPPLWKPLF